MPGDPKQLTLLDCYSMLDEFTALEFNWDSYGADPVSAQTVAIAKHLLRDVPAPYYICPIPDGGILLEWNVKGRELSVDISADGAFGYLLYESRVTSYVDTSFDQGDDLTRDEIVMLIQRVAGDEKSSQD